MTIVKHGILVNVLFQLSFIHSIMKKQFLCVKNNPDTVMTYGLISHAFLREFILMSYTFIKDWLCTRHGVRCWHTKRPQRTYTPVV